MDFIFLHCKHLYFNSERIYIFLNRIFEFLVFFLPLNDYLQCLFHEYFAEDLFFFTEEAVITARWPHATSSHLETMSGTE